MLVGMLVPQGAWAENLWVDGETVTISEDASYDEIEVLPGGELIINKGVTLTVTSLLNTHDDNSNGFGTVINYGTIIGDGSINMYGGVLANHGHIDLGGSNVHGTFTFYNTGTLGGPINLSHIGCDHAEYDNLGTVEATCTHGAGTQYRCKTCYYMRLDETSGALPHDFHNHNGIANICSSCGHTTYDEPANGDGSEEDPYQIANAANLYWFADYTRNVYNHANAILTADIVLNDGTFAADGTFTATGADEPSKPFPWIRIGGEDDSYYGTFDGNGHTISGMYVNDSFGLFYDLYGSVVNLGIVNCYIRDDSGTGAICYWNDGTISNCYTTGILSGSYGYGICNTNVFDSTISNCYSTCSFVNDIFIDGGGICDTNFGTISNCYTSYDTAIKHNGENASEVEVYGGVSAERFASGEIAYKLNGSVDGEGNWTAGATNGTQKWYQKLGENGDSYPVLAAAEGNTVYYGYENCLSENETYSNDLRYAEKEDSHDYHVQLDENEKPVFVWSEDYTTATLQLVCSRDAEHTANVEVTGEGITSEDTTPATCTTAGVRIYTAKATYEGETYTGTKEVEIPAAGHSFVDGVCEVCHATAVAEVKIGETTTGYTDIQEAFDAAMAATGEVTVKLLADVTLTEFENNLDRGEEANRYDVALTLDLNGHNVTGKNSQADIPVTSITLNITDSSEGMTGSINNCLLLVAKSNIYVDEGVTLRAEEWDLVFLQGDCYLENHGNLYGIVVYNAGTTFINCGSVVRAQYFGGDFGNWGSFIPIWYWVYNDVDEVMSSVSVSVNGTIYSSDEGTLEVSSEVTQAPTCTEKGERTYSATVTYEYKDYSDTYTAEIGIDPNAHDFTSKTLTAEPDEHGLYAYACDREGCEGHSDYNVVKGNGEGNNIELIATTDSETGITTYSAESVIIEDGKPFYSPVEFTTRDVDMGRQFTQSIGDAVVPATIVLPFRMYAGEVSTLNPQGVRTGTKFYSFTSLTQNAETGKWEANMDIVIDELEAYTPYMVVLTDGEEIPFGNAPVTFTQTPAELNNTVQGDWTFVATNEAKVWTAADFGHGEAYYGFAAGNETTPEGKFVKVGAGASIDPLRAYIMKTPQTRAAGTLPSIISVRLNETSATGIGTLNIETGEFTFDGWYDLQGRRINEPLKNGISIKNGRKMTKK